MSKKNELRELYLKYMESVNTTDRTAYITEEGILIEKEVATDTDTEGDKL